MILDENDLFKLMYLTGMRRFDKFDIQNDRYEDEEYDKLNNKLIDIIYENSNSTHIA